MLLFFSPPLIILAEPSGSTATYVLIAAAIFIYLLFFSILLPLSYIFEEDFLLIKAGFFLRVKIPYADILSVSQMKMSFFDKAPVTSLDCVKIKLPMAKYESKIFILATHAWGSPYDYALVCPKNKMEFIVELEERISRLPS